MSCWTCDICGEKIRGKTGYAIIADRETMGYPMANRRREKAREEYRNKKKNAPEGAFDRESIADIFLNDPEMAAYNLIQVLHVKCDVNPDTSAYWWGVERIKTLEGWLAFIHHVSTKTWLERRDIKHMIAKWYRNRGEANWPHNRTRVKP